jgi:hypothetical protein
MCCACAIPDSLQGDDQTSFGTTFSARCSDLLWFDGSVTYIDDAISKVFTWSAPGTKHPKTDKTWHLSMSAPDELTRVTATADQISQSGIVSSAGCVADEVNRQDTVFLNGDR